MARPRPGAAEAARGRGVGLGELPNSGLQPVGRNADAGVGDREAQARRPASGAVTRISPRLGELQRVGDQVVEDLPHAGRVAAVDARGAWSMSRAKARPFLLARAAKAAWAPRGDLAEVELDLLQLQLAGLDLGEVEHVVEDRQQRLAGLADHVQPLALRGGQVVRRPSPGPCRARRSAACGSRGSWWPGRGSWRGWPPRRRRGPWPALARRASRGRCCASRRRCEQCAPGCP